MVSFHRMPPELFTGFEVESASGAKVATPEKALFDMLYLAPGRSRLFAKPPELEIPRTFNWAQMQRYTTPVKSASRRALLAHSIARVKKRRAK